MKEKLDMMMVFFAIIAIVGAYMGVVALRMRKEKKVSKVFFAKEEFCLLYTSPSPRD